MSYGPSTRDRRITKPWFPTCSRRPSRSQAPLCLYTQRTISDRAEGTFGRLRYLLGGDRPSQTAHLTLSKHRITAPVRRPAYQGWYSTDGSTETSVPASKPPTYPVHDRPNSNAKLQ